MAKKRMPIYGKISNLRAILVHNLAKYQYFSVRPSTTKLHILCYFQLKRGFYGQKTIKLQFLKMSVLKNWRYGTREIISYIWHSHSY